MLAMVINRKYIKIIFWLLVIMVLVLSFMPGSVSSSIQHVDKLEHLVAFFVLSILLLLAYKFSKPLFTTAIIMALFGMGIEVVQVYIPNRIFSMQDFLADIVGIVLALLVYRIFSRKISIT